METNTTADWADFYHGEVLTEADDAYERFTEDRDAWLFEDSEDDHSTLEEMAEDYGYDRPSMQRMDDCNYDFDNYGFGYAD
ncbi:MAG: hypothetical protein VW865_14180 [Halieaceae bacterium]